MIDNAETPWAWVMEQPYCPHCLSAAFTPIKFSPNDVEVEMTCEGCRKAFKARFWRRQQRNTDAR